jgi:transcriptional regulator with XRE-family HTH domain
MDKDRHRNEFARRFRASIARSGKSELSDGELAKQFGRNGVVVTTQTISNWRNGKHMPKLEQLPGLARSLRTDAAELAFGPATSRVAEPDLARYASNDEEREVVEGYVLLNDRQRALVLDLIRLLTQPGKSGRRSGPRKSM